MQPYIGYPDIMPFIMPDNSSHICAMLASLWLVEIG